MTQPFLKTSKQRSGISTLTALQALTIAVISVAVYYPSLSGTFFWDDYSLVHGHVLERPLRDLWRYPPVLALEEHYWPVTYSVFWLIHALFGYDAFFFRLTNVLFHTANSLIAWRLLHTMRSRGAWLAALLFAVHPVHVESVAWIIELKDVLSGFFFLLATFVFFRATQTTTKTSEVVFYIAAGVCYALGVLSKTVAVGWPLIVFLLIWTNYGRKRRRYQVYAALCFLLVGIVLLALDLSVTHRSAHATPELPILQRLELVGRAFWWYVMKLAAPTPLLALYPKWQLGEASAFRWVGTVGFLIVVAGLLVLLVRRELVVRNIVFWSVWYVVLLAPTLGFVTHSFMIHSYVADRYQYLASLGPIAIVAAGTSWLWEKFANRHVQRLVVAGCAVVILVHFSALTLVHASLYSQPEKLIRHTLAHNPQSANLHTMLGAMLAQRGALDEAAEHFRHAKQLAPTELASRVNLAVVSWQRGAHQEALEETSAVLAVEPARALMWAIRAASLARIGQKDEARQAAYKALELDPAQELAFRVLLEETTTTTVPRTEDQPSIPKE